MARCTSAKRADRSLKLSWLTKVRDMSCADISPTTAKTASATSTSTKVNPREYRRPAMSMTADEADQAPQGSDLLVVHQFADFDLHPPEQGMAGLGHGLPNAPAAPGEHHGLGMAARF